MMQKEMLCDAMDDMSEGSDGACFESAPVMKSKARRNDYIEELGCAMDDDLDL